MELAVKLYLHHPQVNILGSLSDLLKGLNLTANCVADCLQQYNNSLVTDELVDLEFESVESYLDNWLVADLVLSNGDEQLLLPWLTLFHQALPEVDMRFAGQGEPDYFVFIRQQDGQPELLQCEEEEVEELFSYQDWFNEGLPEALQLNYL
ncbi:MAG: hypothetical protein GY951_03840 [Psychromonas sp.]|nr:hypothetical protein [Alteromonadales bacterium]MCP5077172.1 hypothetical protein [Psychromonas sp.]